VLPVPHDPQDHHAFGLSPVLDDVVFQNQLADI
jgi:hypothetical protein